MRKITALLILCVVIFSAYGCATYQAQGANAGLLLGGLTGAILDSRNPWRGGIVGGAVGSVLGATMADISARASYDAARYGAPVEYHMLNGPGILRADPIGYSYGTRCYKVRERFTYGHRTRSSVREICESRIYYPGY